MSLRDQIRNAYNVEGGDGDYPPLWMPDIGDEAVGKIVRQGMFTGKFGEQLSITFKSVDKMPFMDGERMEDVKDGEFSLIASTAVAQWWYQNDPELGSIIRIVRVKDIKVENGVMKNYEITILEDGDEDGEEEKPKKKKKDKKKKKKDKDRLKDSLGDF